MLPNIAPPARIGFLSGLGLALGNVSGIILFLFFQRHLMNVYGGGTKG